MLQIDKFKVNLCKIISLKNKNQKQYKKFPYDNNKQKVKSSINTIESVVISFNDMEFKWIENY